MPRSSGTGELQYDPKIEKIAWQLRKETRQKHTIKTTSSSLELDLAIDPNSPSSDPKYVDETMATERALQELAAPDLNQHLFALNILIYKFLLS